MIRSICRLEDGSLQRDLSQEAMSLALQRPDTLHPLAIEDCQSQGYQSPKVDVFGSYLFIIVHALKVNLSFFLGMLGWFRWRKWL
jgi:hypothetical protein